MNSIPVTYILIGITAITSFASFQNIDLTNKLIFYPAQIQRNKEYWRFITHGLIHGDVFHLLMNMFTLYFFGRLVEFDFLQIFGNAYVFPLFYLSALVVASIPSYYKYKDNYSYRSLGASGAVAAVIFASVILDPWNKIYVYFIGIPGILFAVLYIWYSRHMSQRGMDNIGHDAHLHGSLFGIVFPLVLKPQLIPHFIEMLMHPRF